MRTNEDTGVPILGNLPLEPHDLVNHPKHYQSDKGIECIDAIEAMLGLDGFIAFLRGQVVKYDWRILAKVDPVQDSEKAAWYQDRLTKALREKGLTRP